MATPPGLASKRHCVQGVDDCATVAAVFKLLDSFEGLLERPAIAAQLEVKLTSLLRNFLIDLQEVRHDAVCSLVDSDCSKHCPSAGSCRAALLSTKPCQRKRHIPTGAWRRRLSCGLSSLLAQVEASFSMDKQAPNVAKNAAPHSGRIMWARCLQERITGACR